MSTPQGPDQPWGTDPTAPPQEHYPDAAGYRQGPSGPYSPPGQQPVDPSSPPPYPPQQYEPPQYPPPEQYEPPRYPPPQQYEPPQYPPPQQYEPPQYPPPQQYEPPQYPAQQYQPTGYQQPPGAGQPPVQDFQYGGQQYGGQQYAGYPQTAPQRPPSNRTPLIIAAVAIVVIALAVVGIVALSGDDKKKVAQTPPPTSSTSLPTSIPSTSNPSSTTSSIPTNSSPPASGPVTPTTVPQITVPSVIPGWHGVLSYKENVAYDVPPDWKVETPGTLVGFEDNKGTPIAIMHGVSTYKDNACPGVSGSYRGHTGFKTAAGIAPLDAARSGLTTFADGVALKDNGTSAPISGTTVEPITVDQGKIPAQFARATVTLIDSSDCGSPSVLVVAVAFRTSPNSTALFIGYFDQGVPGALPLATARRIFTTLRPNKR